MCVQYFRRQRCHAMASSCFISCTTCLFFCVSSASREVYLNPTDTYDTHTHTHMNYTPRCVSGPRKKLFFFGVFSASLLEGSETERCTA